MKHKITICLIVIIVLISITTCLAVATSNSWVFFDTPTEIRGGFSTELICFLNTKYQISIPEKATFIKGINTNTIRDPMVVIMFECAIDDMVPSEYDSGYGYSYVFQALNLNESLYTFGGVDEEVNTDWYDDFGGTLDYRIVYKGDPHTFISYSLSNNSLIIRLVVRHPGGTFN